MSRSRGCRQKWAPPSLARCIAGTMRLSRCLAGVETDTLTGCGPGECVGSATPGELRGDDLVFACGAQHPHARTVGRDTTNVYAHSVDSAWRVPLSGFFDRPRC